MRLKRNLFLWRLEEYWFDEKGYLESTADIVALRTHGEVQKFDCCLEERTRLIDLKLDEHEIEKKFSSSLRYGIRQAKKTYTLFKATTLDDRNRFYEAYLPFARERGLLVPKPDEENDLEIFLATDHSNTLVQGSAFLFVPSAKIYRYRYGVTLQKSEANKAILSEAIVAAKNLGCEWFDLGGISPNAQVGSKSAGINSFKNLFGGAEKESHLYIKSKRWYFIFAFRFLQVSGLIKQLPRLFTFISKIMGH